MQFRDRVKELRRVPASQLKPNPRNWRKHPTSQQTALRALLDEVGFAGALNEIGLPEQSIPLALLLFNAGVEIGQLGFIAVVVFVYAILKRYSFDHPRMARQVSGYVIGSVAAYWTIERTVGFWS